jgi:hypothetical protein
MILGRLALGSLALFSLVLIRSDLPLSVREVIAIAAGITSTLAAVCVFLFRLLLRELQAKTKTALAVADALNEHNALLRELPESLEKHRTESAKLANELTRSVASLQTIAKSLHR